MTLKAIVHQSHEGGFWAEVPALPGCLTQSETLDTDRKAHRLKPFTRRLKRG
jgi:hypothetical protein